VTWRGYTHTHTHTLMSLGVSPAAVSSEAGPVKIQVFEKEPPFAKDPMQVCFFNRQKHDGVYVRGL
jgi:hypothetical protein